jgi:hypothetical protein
MFKPTQAKRRGLSVLSQIHRPLFFQIPKGDSDIVHSIVRFCLHYSCRTSEKEGICQDDPHLDNSSTSVKDEEVAQRLHSVDEISMARSPLNDELKGTASIWSNVMSSGAEKPESAGLPGNISPGSNRPSSAARPCTAPVLYTPARSSHYVGPQVISRTSTSGSGTMVSITCPDEFPAPEMELSDESPFAFSVPIVTNSRLPYSPPIDIVAKGSSFPNATVWDVCGSWP